MEHPDCGLGAAPRSDLPPTPPPSRVGSVAINKGPSSNLERGTSGVAHTYTLLGSQPAYTLNSGYSIPAVGLGTWLSEPGQVKTAVEVAVRAGYRHIDCAHVYGNEHEVGEGLATIFSEGIVKREDLFITSKLWNDCHAPPAVKSACHTSLKNLGLGYLDLYLMHFPVVTGCKGPTLDPTFEATWAAMETLVDEGLVRSIGTSNFSVVKLTQLLKTCRIKPAVNQVEVHPLFRNDALIQYCKEQGIHVTAYSPLGTPGAKQLRQGAPNLMEDDLVQKLARKYGKQPGQVLLRWGLQHGTSVLPKSVNPERIVANLDVLDWQLEQEDFKALSSYKTQVRLLDASSFALDPEGPYKTLTDLWDE